MFSITGPGFNWHRLSDADDMDVICCRRDLLDEAAKICPIPEGYQHDGIYTITATSKGGTTKITTEATGAEIHSDLTFGKLQVGDKFRFKSPHNKANRTMLRMKVYPKAESLEFNYVILEGLGVGVLYHADDSEAVIKEKKPWKYTQHTRGGV